MPIVNIKSEGVRYILSTNVKFDASSNIISIVTSDIRASSLDRLFSLPYDTSINLNYVIDKIAKHLDMLCGIHWLGYLLQEEDGINAIYNSIISRDKLVEIDYNRKELIDFFKVNKMLYK